MGVSRWDCLNLGHEVACYGRREAETGLQSGWSNVNKHAIGDGLRAGVAEDDLSEKALGADDRRFACRRAGAVKGDRREAKRNKCTGSPQLFMG
jgi:hypothetical protein